MILIYASLVKKLRQYFLPPWLDSKSAVASARASFLPMGVAEARPALPNYAHDRVPLGRNIYVPQPPVGPIVLRLAPPLLKDRARYCFKPTINRQVSPQNHCALSCNQFFQRKIITGTLIIASVTPSIFPDTHLMHELMSLCRR